MEQAAKTRVAILGATGYIGRSLYATAAQYNFEAVPFSRDSETAQQKLASYGLSVPNVLTYDQFLDQSFDIIINATGIGSPRELSANPAAVFAVTEKMDDLLFSYLAKFPETRVFNLSSGAVKSGKTSDYARAKLSSEERHRAKEDLAIIDLRVFAFISRWLDVDESFFVAEVAKCLKEKTIFQTNSSDMTRDYCTAEDLWEAISFLSEKPPLNTVFDMRSRAPVGKFELLEELSKKFGLQYEIKEAEHNSPTGQKNAYYSTDPALFDLGFTPARTSLENVTEEIAGIIHPNP